jgi:hypothetical protein
MLRGAAAGTLEAHTGAPDCDAAISPVLRRDALWFGRAIHGARRKRLDTAGVWRSAPVRCRHATITTDATPATCRHAAQRVISGMTMRDELEVLPGVGPSIAADLRGLGVKSLRDLARRDPERLYQRLCDVTGQRQDPCVLYTFRCAVYAARSRSPDPALLKWWAWKNRRLT